MRVGAGVGGLALASAGLLVVSACGQSSRAGGISGGGGEGGSVATGGVGGCDPNMPPQASIPVVELPARLEGVLCTVNQSLALSFPRQEGGVGERLAVRLVEGAGSYRVALHEVAEGGLEPLQSYHDTNVFSLSAARPDVYLLTSNPGYAENRVLVELSGTPGRVALDLERVEAGPGLGCNGEYESFPVETPPLDLPAVVEAELCSARDSRVWAANVEGGRPVVVSLENPRSIDHFSLSAYRGGLSDYVDLPVSEGDTRLELGLFTEWSRSFTPLESGVVAFFAGVGFSRGEPFRLRIEQP